ncbi:MAG: nucleotide sugar dehydrogenase [Candidatus Buchananbacteria bacterium]
MKNDIRICIVGLGYVGLPLACLLSKNFVVSGFDISAKKIIDLKNGFDETGEVQNLTSYNINYSADPAIIKDANFIIVAVPTPVTADKQPDLAPLQSASKIVGQNLTAGSIVVYESTVYPGCTEEICLPILEKESGLKFNQDFKIGYSPERINPGDRVHTIDKIVKIVAGSDKEALAKIAAVYGSFTQIHQAPNLKVAEAAKVIENVQRDLNISLMNELALIFDRLGISTRDVLAAAGTKWNFHKYQPGLVGGHCIDVDPYYLTYKAEQVGYKSKVILAGRKVTEGMPAFVASKLAGKKNILILGLTFKENVPDTRNSKAKELAQELKAQGSQVYGFDPVVKKVEHLDYFQVNLIKTWPPTEKFDGIVIFSPHQIFSGSEFSLTNLRQLCLDQPALFDIKGLHSKDEAQAAGFKYYTL